MKLQLKQNYTSRQLSLIAPFRENGEVTIEEIIQSVERRENKKISNNSAISQLQNMATKLAQDGYLILRTSKLGRGNKGQWKLKQLT